MKTFTYSGIKLIVLFFFLVSCKNETNHNGHKVVQNSDRPLQAITYTEMATMFKAYDNGQKLVLDKYISTRTKGRDSIETVSQFFSLSEIKQYIAYIERLSEEKNIDLTGIRIFTAAYPSDYKIKEYQNRVSFILAPTANIGNQKNVAFEPLKSDMKKPISMKSILDKYSDESSKRVNRAAIFSFDLLQELELSSALNRGSIRPPY